MYGPASVDFWGELDADVLRCLAEQHGAMTPTEIGRKLGMSEQGVCSIIGMLAQAGKVRIRALERIV
jgi:predicted transcriptional regulator